MLKPLDTWLNRFALLTVVLLVSACAEEPARRAEFYVFGTLVEVSVFGVDEEQAGLAFAALQTRFQQMHSDWHAWEPGKLSEVNRAISRGESIALDAELIDLIRQSQVIEQRSGGRFNPAIGQLVALWGFHTSDYPVSGPAPGSQQIRNLLLQNASTANITITEDVLSSSNPHVQLDFGGIAKGYAVDLAIELLNDFGIKHAIVNAGGDLRVAGQRGKRAWRVAIQNPLGGLLGGLETTDEAIFTSGNYQRYREDENLQRWPHILDPRTGWPAAQVMSATVIAPTGLLADGAATALVVAGLSEWQEVAKNLGLEQILLTAENGEVYVTHQMLLRMNFEDGVEPIILNWQEN